MASLGVTPGQDGPKNRNCLPMGYPYELQSPAQRETREENQKMSIKSSSALSTACTVVMTTTDPQLNLKQAIKLQFEGPTSAALYKRETPL